MASRPRRHRRGWLRDTRGRSYRLGPTDAFQVYYQASEGQLWTRVFRDGVPLKVDSGVTRDEFLEAVDHQRGAYQLQPLDKAGRPFGDPPAIVFLPCLPIAEPQHPAAIGLVRIDDESGPHHAGA